jgi:hypothetical protein
VSCYASPPPPKTPEDRLRRILDLIDSAKVRVHCTECMEWQNLSDRIYRMARIGTEDAG